MSDENMTERNFSFEEKNFFLTFLTFFFASTVTLSTIVMSETNSNGEII